MGWRRHSSELVRHPNSGGNITPHSLAQQLLLASQAAFNLGRQLCGEAQVLQGLSCPLSLLVIALEALLRFEAATLSWLSLVF